MPSQSLEAPPGWKPSDEDSQDVTAAWAEFYATGDRTRLVELGILPVEETA